MTWRAARRSDPADLAARQALSWNPLPLSCSLRSSRWSFRVDLVSSHRNEQRAGGSRPGHRDHRQWIAAADCPAPGGASRVRHRARLHDHGHIHERRWHGDASHFAMRGGARPGQLTLREPGSAVRSTRAFSAILWIRRNGGRTPWSARDALVPPASKLQKVRNALIAEEQGGADWRPLLRPLPNQRVTGGRPGTTVFPKVIEPSLHDFGDLKHEGGHTAIPSDFDAHARFMEMRLMK